MNPITREEKLLDGQELVPISRKEAFIRRIYDKTQVVPEPITREEWFLNKAAEGGGGDVTIEQLNVTQNGTYSEQGKAYSPVVVDVPEAVLTTKNITANGTYSASADNADGFSSVEVSVAPPENSYLLTTKKDDVVDISDAASIPIVDLKADVSAASEVAVGVGDGDEFISDNAPYLFRPTLGRQSNVKQVAEKIVGASFPVNQGIVDGDFSSTTNWSYVSSKISASNNELTVTAENQANGQSAYTKSGVSTTWPVNHKILATVDIKSNASIRAMRVALAYNTITKNIVGTIVPTTSWQTLTGICNISEETSGIRIGNVYSSDMEVGDTFTLRNVMAIDLTLMFGSTIADYVYTLEQSEAGAGIAWLKANGFFTKDYYPYNAGSIESVKTSAHKMVGFNAYNNTTGKAKLLGGHEYQITGAYTALAYSTGETITPDANGKFTPTADGELTVTGGNGTTTCVHLVWDGERDGQYEEYKEHTYPLDSDLELRGIPKLDTNNKLYYDGDTYESDGTVTRKYGIVDLGSLTWIYKANTFGGCFSSTISNAGFATTGNSICAKYPTVFSGTDITNGDKVVYTKNNGNTIHIKDSAYSDAATFKTAMSGVYLVYELATPTTESADPFTNPQIVDNWGTEEFVDERTVPIPVGHETKYFDGEIFFSYIYDGSGNKTTATGTADLITGEVTGGNHCDTFVIKPTGDNVVVETGEVEVKYLVPLEAI